MGYLNLDNLRNLADLTGPRPVLNPLPTAAGRVPASVSTIPEGFRGTEATIKEMRRLARAASLDPKFVMFARSIVAGLPSKAYYDEANRIFEFVRRHVRYVLDPRGMEYVQDPRQVLFVDGQGDCFVKGTKVLLRKGRKLVPVESLREGDEIWGYNRWSRVNKTWERGMRPTYLILLNNGSRMRLTAEHKVWVLRCHHKGGNTLRCRCDPRDIKPQRITVEELRPKDLVLCPEKVDCGEENIDPRKAYVEGLYIADGYRSHSEANEGHPLAFQISGRDGFPREAQKREVETICKELGITTNWWYNAISVNDRDWSDRMGAMGTLPWDKRFLSLNLDEATTKESLRGVLADSGRNKRGAGRCYTTSSEELHLQVRVLLKTMGITCGERFVLDHGSTSEHPIWRLEIRQCQALDDLGTIYDKAWRKDPPKKFESSSKRKPKALRIREIIKDNKEQECFDFETDDHFVWLPEADWTVSQCDDQSVVIAAIALSLGHEAAFKTIAVDPNRPTEFSHVYALIGIQKGLSTEWWSADTTQKTAHLGWEPPRHLITHEKVWSV